MNIPYCFKKCGTCGEWLVASTINFHKNKDGKWRLKSKCKKCEKEYYGQYYENNKEHKRIISKQYYEDNKEHVKERHKQWREENKEHVKEYGKQYYENNKEHVKEYGWQWYEDNKEHKKIISKQWYEDNKEHWKEYGRQYYENNKEQVKERHKQYYKNNPEKFFNNRNKRRSKLENQGRGITEEQWKECNSWFNWGCAYSGETLKNTNDTYGRTLDHIVAIDNGGLNEPWNVISMRKGYNSSKNSRTDTLNWYLQQEYFDIDRLDKIIEWQIYAYEKWGGEEFGELILITDLLED